MKIVIMLAAIVCVASDPTPFYDTHAHYSITTIEPLLKMTANYTFSAALNSEKMARSGNGGACFPANPTSTAACTEVTTGKSRWLTWPAENKCCLCCSYEQGCGPLQQGWISKNGKYLGQEMYKGTLSDKWIIQGNSANFYFQDAKTGNPRALLQNCANPTTPCTGPNSEEDDFDAGTLNLAVVSAGEFLVPQECDPKNLCGGECAFLRNLTAV